MNRFWCNKLNVVPRHRWSPGQIWIFQNRTNCVSHHATELHTPCFDVNTDVVLFQCGLLEIRPVLSRRAPVARPVTQIPFGHLLLALLKEQIWSSVPPIGKRGTTRNETCRCWNSPVSTFWYHCSRSWVSLSGAQPFHTQESARVPGFTVMPAKPIPGPHWLHPSAPHSHIGKPPPPLPKDSHRYSPSTFKGPYGAGPSTSTGILPGNRHTVANGNPPRPPKTLASPPTYGQCVQPSQTHSQNPYENHRFNTKDAAVPHPADNRGSGRTLQSWNSQNAEDDGASTTSGSYVVDSSDLFLEDYPPVRGVVVWVLNPKLLRFGSSKFSQGTNVQTGRLPRSAGRLC